MFDNIFPSPMGTVHMINYNVSELLHSEITEQPVSLLSQPKNVVKSVWRPPLLGSLKINTDAS